MCATSCRTARFLMLTREDDVEIHALHKRGWSISAIARHTGRNRRTVRNYINGVTAPGVRKPGGEDSFAPFVDYVSARLREDPHLWARTLCDELEGLGFALSYPSLTRNIRARGSAAGVRGLPVGDGPGECGHRASAGRRNPVGLAGFAESTGVVGVGPYGASVGRVAVAFGQVARVAGAVDRSAAPGAGPGPGRRELWAG